MKIKASDLAVNLFEIAGPIFVSLKEQVNAEKNRSKAKSDSKDLTFTQVRILLAIEYGKDQVGKLAKGANVAQPAMSKLVDSLIAQGFVRRDPHPTDRRIIKLSLTPKGIAMNRRMLSNASEKYVEAIGTLSASDQKKLFEGVAVIFDVIEKTRERDV